MTTQYNSYDTEGYTAEVPGKGLGIIALVLSLINIIGFPTALVGVILGHIALKRSKLAGFTNTPAFVAVVVGWVMVGISTLVFLTIVGLILAGIAAG